MNELQLITVIHWVVRGLEIAGVIIIVFGAIAAIVRLARESWIRRSARGHAEDLHSDLGRSILLGLEFLVAGDIINTVAIEPTLDSLAVLAGVVAIRTFLSFSLRVELEGVWPWARGRGGASQMADQ